ncbi:MAG: GTP-binding protein, partial [Deltaproteobacteria bacterium]|nr:GTP-binding protein [Deltaproteobacteria bacterium]
IELTSGCICCTLILDLRILLNRIWENYHPRWIFIEASGVADPASLVSLLHEDEIACHIESFKAITVLDADCWEMREIMGQLFHRQLESADMILLNKVDLLDAETVRKCLSEVRSTLPHTQVMPTVHCWIDPESILWEVSPDETEQGLGEPVDVFQLLKSLKEEAAEHHDHDHAHDETHSIHAAEAGFAAFSFKDLRPMDEARFKRFVDELPFEVFRLKGTVRFQDRVVFVNHVGGKTQWTDCAWSEETLLAFVGWEIQEEEIIKKLKECFLPG